MDWIYYKPHFECDDINEILLKYSPWSSHRFFAYDLISALSPQHVVELGSHYGSSFFSFAQAVKDHRFNTCLTAIDTWQGDDFTRHYQNDVFESFSKIQKEIYPEVNIQPLRCTFDEALALIPDHSIDILHIDGSHYYDDVKHDFESWFPKVKPSGIILLHDISDDLVLNQVMGSHEFWLELKQKFANTWEFTFSWGLGIIFLDATLFQEILPYISTEHYQKLSNGLDIECRDSLRKDFFTINDQKFYISDLRKQLEIKNEHLNRYSKNESVRQEYITHLEEDIDNIKTDYQTTIDGKDKYISDLEMENSDLLKKESIMHAMADEKECISHELEKAKLLYSETQKKLQESKDILNSIQENLNIKQSENEELINRLAKANFDIQTYKNQQHVLEKRNETLNKEYQNLEEKYHKTFYYQISRLFGVDNK